MFKTIYLLSHAILAKPLSIYIDGKEMQLRAISLDTSPPLLLEPDCEGWRVSDREELEAFAKKYKPGFLFEIHAVDNNTEPSLFGPMAKVFRTVPGGAIELADQNPVRGMPRRTIFLWVRESADRTHTK